MTSWNLIEDAIRKWVRDASRLADGQVIWSDQDGPRPLGVFITIRLGDLLPLGAVDETATDYDPTGGPGEEIVTTVRGVREFPVSIQCFGTDTVGRDTARALLSRVQTALGLPSVREALGTVGLSPFDAGQVRNLSVILDAQFEGRALLEVRFYVVEEMTERTTYISTVEVTDESTDRTFTVTV